MIKTKCECGRGVWYLRRRLFKYRPIERFEQTSSQGCLRVIHVYIPHRCKFYKEGKEGGGP